jgi:hypothetical protein
MDKGWGGGRGRGRGEGGRGGGMQEIFADARNVSSTITPFRAPLVSCMPWSNLENNALSSLN